MIDFYSDYKIVIGNKETGYWVNAADVFGTQMNNTEGDILYSQVFMGDKAEIHIMNQAKANDDSKALIIKDSYANAINLLVAENFSSTTILDIRYFNECTIEQYIKDHHFDIILILYNGETFLNNMYNFSDKF